MSQNPQNHRVGDVFFVGRDATVDTAMTLAPKFGGSDLS